MADETTRVTPYEHEVTGKHLPGCAFEAILMFLDMKFPP